MVRLSKFAFHGASAAMLLAVLAGTARAEPVKILAIGASNVTGRGVGAANAWPAHLDQMLKKKGYDVALTVSAFDGETSSTTVSRAPGAIQPGTKIVLYLLSRDNDAKAGGKLVQVTEFHSAVVGWFLVVVVGGKTAGAWLNSGSQSPKLTGCLLHPERGWERSRWRRACNRREA